MIDWTHIGLAGVVAMLALIGVAGITLLPLRAYTRLRGHARGWAQSPADRAAFVLVAVAAATAVLFGAPHLARVGSCLTDMACGPNRASGAISLAVFGANYLAFEAAALAAWLLTRRRGASALTRSN
jgi:hypothetical protein